MRPFFLVLLLGLITTPVFAQPYRTGLAEGSSCTRSRPSAPSCTTSWDPVLSGYWFLFCVASTCQNIFSPSTQQAWKLEVIASLDIPGNATEGEACNLTTNTCDTSDELLTCFSGFCRDYHDEYWAVKVFEDITGMVPLQGEEEREEREKEREKWEGEEERKQREREKEREEWTRRETSSQEAAAQRATTSYGIAVVVGGAVLLLILLLFLSKNCHCCPVKVRGKKKKYGRGDVQGSEVSGLDEGGGESVEPPESGSLDIVVVGNESRREVQHPLGERSAEAEEIQSAYSLGT